VSKNQPYPARDYLMQKMIETMASLKVNGRMQKIALKAVPSGRDRGNDFSFAICHLPFRRGIIDILL